MAQMGVALRVDELVVDALVDHAEVDAHDVLGIADRAELGARLHLEREARVAVRDGAIRDLTRRITFVVVDLGRERRRERRDVRVGDLQAIADLEADRVVVVRRGELAPLHTADHGLRWRTEWRRRGARILHVPVHVRGGDRVPRRVELPERHHVVHPLELEGKLGEERSLGARGKGFLRFAASDEREEAHASREDREARREHREGSHGSSSGDPPSGRTLHKPTRRA